MLRILRTKTIHALCAIAVCATATFAQAGAAAKPAPQGSDLAATVMIDRFRERHHAGRFRVEVMCVRESFLGGRDTLRGELSVEAKSGERRLTLRGAGFDFEWWSRANGLEQWHREGVSGSLRRLPPHSRKKPAFTPDISFEDLARLPFDYFEGHRAARRSGETDSTVSVRLAPGGPLGALYAEMDVTFHRTTALVSRIVFSGNGSRPSKHLVIRRYIATSTGFFPVDLEFSSADGLSSTRLELTLLSNDPARDKVDAEGVEGAKTVSRFAEPRWVPRDQDVEQP
jgi:hypothetical protein